MFIWKCFYNCWWVLGAIESEIFSKKVTIRPTKKCCHQKFILAPVYKFLPNAFCTKLPTKITVWRRACSKVFSTKKPLVQLIISRHLFIVWFMRLRFTGIFSTKLFVSVGNGKWIAKQVCSVKRQTHGLQIGIIGTFAEKCCQTQKSKDPACIIIFLFFTWQRV